MHPTFNQNRLLTLIALGEIETVNESGLNDVGELLDDLHRRRIEDQYDLMLADKCIREMRRARLKAIPMDLVIEKFDLAVSRQPPLSDIF